MASADAPAAGGAGGAGGASGSGGEASSSAARVRLLQGVLAKSAGQSDAAAQKLGALLRKWAVEQRPYRRQLFSPAEVEAAVAAAAGTTPSTPVQGARRRAADAESAVKGGSAGRPTAADEEALAPVAPARGRSVEVKAGEAWPSRATRAAALEVASSLGPVPTPAAAAEGTIVAELLRGLFRVLGVHRQPSTAEGILSLTSAQGAVSVHQAVLSAMSPMIKARFEGGFADSLGCSVNAAQFDIEVVRGAVEFVYTGVCRIHLMYLTHLWSFADFFGIEDLSVAVEQSWSVLPVVKHLQVLSGVSTEDSDPAPFLAKLCAAVASGFERAVVVLQGSGVEVFVVWRFLKDLHDYLVDASSECLQRLRDWLSREAGLGEAVEKFLVGALRSASMPEDVKRLCASNMKAWLPLARIRRITLLLCSALGFVKEEDQVQPWLSWTYLGTTSFATLWEIYEVLLAHQRRAASGDLEEAPPLQQGLHSKSLPEEVEVGFAMAFANAVQQSPAAAKQFDDLYRTTPRVASVAPALQESWNAIARMLCHNKVLPAGLSDGGVLALLSQAVARLVPVKVCISGAPGVAGSYAAASAAGLAFLCAAAPGRPALALRRVNRNMHASKEGLAVAWKGVPIKVMRASPVEWKIQRADDDEQLDTPFALAFDEAMDPTQISAGWWICGRYKKFVQTTDISICAEAISDAEAAPYVEALSSWITGGGSLNALEKVASTSAMSACGVLLQLCRLARDVAHTLGVAADASLDSDMPAAPGVAGVTRPDADMPAAPAVDRKTISALAASAAEVRARSAAAAEMRDHEATLMSGVVESSAADVATNTALSRAGNATVAVASGKVDVRSDKVAGSSAPSVERVGSKERGQCGVESSSHRSSAPSTASKDTPAEVARCPAASSPSFVEKSVLAEGDAGIPRSDIRRARLKNMGPRFDGLTVQLLSDSLLRVKRKGSQVKTWQVELPDGRSTWILADMFDEVLPDCRRADEAQQSHDCTLEAAKVVAETAAAVAQVLGDLVEATSEERKAALGRKRALESAPAYIAALRCLEGADDEEEPADKRQRQKV
mmetsp:Transcript_174617/g.559857  ORF Transcript_174617/g.559857 Transcript_174617/m.559857 type:complete len:1066 (-) Transcript_174617:100-3297(-)